MNSWKSDEVIEMMMHQIHNNLILKRSWKLKLRKTFLQLKQKWMKETLEQMKMKWSHFYMMILWSKSSRIVIGVNKKISISQHCFDIFTLKQRVYLNDSDSRENVTMIMMKINWKLDKRLKWIDFNHHSSWRTEKIDHENEISCRCSDKELKVSWKDIQSIQW